MMLMLWMIAALYTVVTTAQTSFTPVRINCGGSRFTDPITNFAWKGDSKTYVTSGTRQTRCRDGSLTIANTTQAMRGVYCCNRYFKPSGGTQHYTIPVLNTSSSYIIRLHFAELDYVRPNDRKMDVVINGKLYLDDFDIVASSSFKTAFVYQTPTPVVVNNGIIKIDFRPVVNNAMISGIEVLLAPSTPRPTTKPTKSPTQRPSSRPSNSPTTRPTDKETNHPTLLPTKAPSTDEPLTPTIPTKSPTQRPSGSRPSKTPTTRPTDTKVTNRPSLLPTKAPSTAKPTSRPTYAPSLNPIQDPTTQTPFVYYRTNDTNLLGVPDVNIGLGNPLKGLAGGPRWSQQSPLPNSVPSAIEFYNIALDEVMVGDNEFNWTLHDQFLRESANRKMHAVLSVFIDWPGRPIRLPPHLKDLPLYETTSGTLSLHYGNERLLIALRQFIFAWSAHIDGDTRIAGLHVGLLGYWGEGHTYPDEFVPESSKVSVAQWYRDAFNVTHIQARYPGPNADGFGLYDGSLAYSTLDGAANGGVNVGWFQYPRMVNNGQANIWKEHMMGGETRPELQNIIFTDTYPARTENHQDYKECIDALHLSYAVHHGAFQNGGYTGNTLLNANMIHAYMGYAFYVSDIEATTTSTNAPTVNVTATVTQLGVAPFYYDLSLVLQCDGGNLKMTLPGVNGIIQKGDSRTFTFPNVPATSSCLGQVKLSLNSSYMYPARPILFAQGSNGSVVVNIPVPGSQTRSGLMSSALNVAMLQLFDAVKNLVV